MAQHVSMESIYAEIELPDPWLVLSPQTISIYEPLLQENEMNVADMQSRYTSEGVVVEAWDEDFMQSIRIMTTSNERSQTIYDISRATKAQRNSLLAYYNTSKNWTNTYYRYQQAEWQNHSSMGRFLFLRYNYMDGDTTVRRGVQYLTIRNGLNYIIEWTIPDRRFTNKDLREFKALLNDFSFTKELEAPPLPVSLSATIPAESGKADIQITGTTSSKAVLSVDISEGENAAETISVGSAKNDGSFTINFTLPQEGTYRIVLTAYKDGYAETALSQTLVYQAQLLPINIDAYPTDPWTQDTFTLSGDTLPGAALQLLSDVGVTTKKAGNSGSFTFTLNVKEEMSYSYTLVISKDKYTQRRIPITINRVFTQDQELSKIKKTAEQIGYNKLQSNAEVHAGKVMRLSGQIISVTEGSGVWFIRLMLSKDSKGNWFRPVVISCPTDPQLAIDTKAVIYGYVADGYVEQDTSGEDVVVPGFTFICVD